jgi:osmotically-inducible protein OsmY
VGLEGIDVQVDDAIVTLEGKTGNLLEKEHAVIHARYQPGVRAVIDRLTVTPQRRADAEVQSDVEQALVDDPATDAFEVKPRVEEGVVTLEGSVDSETEKELAAKVSAGVGGVRRVQNELAVATTLARTDMEISADIRGRLLADPLVDASGVTVRVTDGRAELWGRVPTAEERARVLWDAWVKGVRAVEADELVVGTECPTP